MKINQIITFAACLLLCMMGCKKIEDPAGTHSDERFGLSKTVQLTVVMDSIPEGKLTCLLISNDETLRLIDAIHTKTAKGSLFEFEHFIPVGKKVFAEVIYNTALGKRHKQVGCTIEIGEKENRGNSESFDEFIKLFGEGTEKSPYKISSTDGFVAMQVYMMEKSEHFKGVYFEQLNDINCNKVDFPLLPIGSESGYYGGKPSVAFMGIFNGNHKKINALIMTPDLTSPASNISTNPGAVGLFAVAAGATFKNVVIENSRMQSYATVGLLVGCVRSDANDRTTTFDSCRVVNSTVNGDDFVGGMVGYCDQPAIVTFSNCSSENVTFGIKNESTYIGGLLGGCAVNTEVMMINCTNSSSINTGKQCIGGLAGGVSKITLHNCTNSGNISTTQSALGIGGLIGGNASYASISASENFGKISAENSSGVGGLVGSSLLIESSELHADVGLTSVANHAEIIGKSRVGGLVGEAQASISSAHNFGKVTAKSDVAGGIIGHAAALVASGCHNTGDVKSSDCSGGIAALSDYYIILNSANYGVVTGGEYAAGMLASAGSTGFINYCANYGKINGTGSYVAGIVGKAGKRYVPSGTDIACVVCALAAGMTSGTLQILNASGVGNLKLASNIAGIVRTLNSVGWLVYSIVDKIIDWATPEQQILLNSFSQAEIEESLDVINKKSTDKLRTSYAKLATLSIPDLNPAKISSATFDNLISIQSAADMLAHDDTRISDAIHGRLSEIESDVVAAQKALSIASMVLSGVATISGFVSGRFAAIGPQTASGGLSITGSLITLTKTLLTTETNVVEITQCANFAKITSNTDSYGIVASLGDWVRLSNSFGIGNTVNDGGSVAKEHQQKAKYIYGLGNNKPFRQGSGGNDGAEVFYSAAQIGSSDHNNNALNASELKDPNTYSGFNSNLWDTKTICPPVFKNSIVFDFK